MKSWKYALTAALLPATLWAATISGTVGAPAPGTPVGGVKVVLIDNNSAGPHVDSTTTNGAGTYTLTAATTGTKVVQASLSGYNSAVTLQGVSSAGQVITGVNLSISINNKTSVIQGTVKKAVDSTPAVAATVTLSGGTAGDNPRNATTDSLGNYKFDSVSTGTGYNVAVAKSGFQGTSTGNVAVAWNASTTVGTQYLTSNLGSISGTIRRNDSATVVIVGAKVVFSVGTAKVDSTTTDANGNYSKVLNAATYNISVSAAGMKSNRGLATKDTTAIVVFGSNTVMNTGLTPALSTIGGTLHGTNATTGPIISGAKVVLQRRMGSTGAANVWYTLDSTFSDANGIFSFSNLIAAPTPASAANGSYRVLVTANAYRNYPLTTGAENTADVYQVAYGATYIVTPNIAMTLCTAAPTAAGCVVGIVSYSHDQSLNIRLSLMGSNLALDLDVSNVARTVQIFSLNGSLAHQVSVPAGATRAIVPATFAAGYLFQVK